jgi:hypothetical protein
MIKKLLLCLFIVVVFLSVTATAHAQSTPPATEAASADTVAGLAAWLALILVFLGGAVGGVVFELIALQGRIELPHRPSPDEVKKDMTEDGNYAISRYMVDLGILARVLIGGVAAVITLIIFTPENLVQLLGVAAVAGSAGTAVFRTIQDRLLATLAQKDAALARAQTSALTAKVTEAEQAVGALKTTLESTAASTHAESFRPEGTSSLESMSATSTTAPAATLALVNNVQRLLSEAKGIGGAP